MNPAFVSEAGLTVAQKAMRTSALKAAASKMTKNYKFAGLYDLRLRLSQAGDIMHINEYLYSDVELDTVTPYFLAILPRLSPFFTL